MQKTCLLFPGQGSIKLSGNLTGASQLITSAITLADALKFMKDNPGEFTAVGHSLGEFAMFCAAGVFTAEEMFNILDVRATAMKAACEAVPGAMYAVIGIPAGEIALEGDVWAVNFNSDVQTVISGELGAVTAAAEKLSQAGVKTVKLDVAGAFHTKFMEPAAKTLRDYLADKKWSKPEFPLYSTYTGKLFTDFDNLPEYLYNQMISPVRFTDAIKAIRADNPDIAFHEYGKTLTGMLKRIK
ncbi:MAG: ACP S-malonyltransferase [Ruminococcus sp.]|jgi:[acyl-carrier-protein] S-malonyltransferase|nr:ACP S-malonyltransferase [Ruminococcus sp.]